MEDINQLIRMEMGQLSRRLRGMAMISRGIVPNLVVSQKLVDRVVAAAQSHLADETGETMVGLVQDTDQPESMPTLYVLDTISPDESSIRRSHMFEQGDDLQGDIFLWLKDNWDVYLELGRDMNGKPIPDDLYEPLRHLGDWHKQPGFMIQPSGGDLMTALRMMEEMENDFEFLLVPIVTLGHPSVTSEEGAHVNYFNVPMGDGTSLRMDWWYIHRDVRVFQPITPKVVPAEDLPALAPYPWHILDTDLLDEEVGLLQDDEMFLIGSTSILWSEDEKLPLEICFILGRAGRNDVFLVVTDWDYPKSPPRARIAPFAGVDTSMYIYDIFKALWQQSRPVEEPDDFTWDSEGSYIVDYLAAVEQEMGIRPDGLPMPWERDNLSAAEVGAVNIAVEIDDDDDAAVTDDIDADVEADATPADASSDADDTSENGAAAEDETIADDADDAADEASENGATAEASTDAGSTDDTDADSADDAGSADDADDTVAEIETSKDKTS